MSETLKMIVRELPRTMGELNHKLLYDDLKQALKEVKDLEQQLAEAHRAAEESAKDAYRRGWEQGNKEAFEIARTTQIGYIQTTIAEMEYKERTNG